MALRDRLSLLPGFSRLPHFPQGLSKLWNEDDVGFIREVVQYVQRDLPIPEGRTFALGFSFGGTRAEKRRPSASPPAH